MEEKRLKEVINKIHIKDEMEEQILHNVINGHSEANRRRAAGWRSKAAAAAIAVAAIGIIGVTSKAVMNSFVKQRMESLPKQEVQEIVEEIDSSPANADSFSRDYTKEEEERMAELAKAYQGGRFPETEIVKVETKEQIEEGTLCFVPELSYFSLPDRELTDEELLQIIDFNTKRNFALQERYEEEHADEIQARQEKAKEVESAGGISEEEAVIKANDWLNKIYGQSAEGMEVNHHISMVEEKVLYTVTYRVMGMGNYYFYISAVDGSLCRTIYSGGDILEAEEMKLADAEGKLQAGYQAAEDYLRHSFGISEEYTESYGTYCANAAGDAVDLNMMTFFFVKADRTAYAVTVFCDDYDLFSYQTIENYEEYLKQRQERDQMLNDLSEDYPIKHVDRFEVRLK